MVIGGSSAHGLGVDFVVLTVATTLLVLVAAKLYPNVAR